MRNVLGVLLCFAVFIFAQGNDSIIKDARKALGSKDYAAVIKMYNAFSDTANENNSTFEFLKPIYIEALSFQKKYDEVSSLAEDFTERFPNGSQSARVYYLLGVAKANLGDFVQALIALDNGLNEVKKDKSTEKSIRDLIETISEKYISPEDKQKALTSGLSGITVEVLSNETSQNPDVKKSSSSISKTIGLLIPMTGEYSDLGKTTLNVVNMILTQYEAQTGEKIAVKVYDTEGNAVKAAIKTRELLNDKVSMVIGPIMSNTATVAAAILSEYPDKAVMITPTATDDGIADLGKNIFQLNLTQRALAEKIAFYAVEDLNIKRFTILAPLNEYGRVMTEYFSAAVKEKGAVVEFSEYFSSDASDHRKQFNALREYYTNLKFGEETSKPKMQYLADSTIVLGGLFIPVSQAENAIQLAAQVPFHKLRAQILGANVWDNQKVIDDGKTTVQNVSFSSSQKIDRESDAFVKFVQNYKAKFNEEPNLVVAPLVADAAVLMLKAFSQSNNAADLAKNLSSVQNFQGLSSEISFENGVNSEAVVMKISGQKTIRVK